MRMWLVLGCALPCFALSTFRGLQPGVSSRSDVERVLGASEAGSQAEYRLSDQSGTALVRYQIDIVEEIEYKLAAPLDHDEVVSLLKLPAPLAVSPNAQSGMAEEYFDGAHTLILVHASASRNSPVAAIRYLSREGYDRAKSQFQSNDAQPPQPPPPQQPQQPQAPPPITEQRVRYDPAACKDIYDWARSEVEIANKSKKADRRQAIIEVRINAQKGDCGLARDLASRYKSTFK